MTLPSPSTATNDAPDLNAQLTDAAIAVLAAWHNGCSPAAVEQLTPRHLSDPRTRALWFEILDNEAWAAGRSLEDIHERAREAAGVTLDEWQAFCDQIAQACPTADAESMKKNAARLLEHYEQQERARRDAEEQRLLVLEQRLIAEEQERRNRKPAFTPEDVTNIVYHGQVPPRLDVVEDTSPLEPVTIFPQAQERGGGERLVFRSAVEALESLPPIEWLVDRILAPRSMSIWFGKPGTKKTYALLWLAVCVATGRDWLGFKTRPAKVVILDEESGEDRLHRRLHEVLNGAGITADIPLKWTPPCQFKLTEQEDVLALRSKLLENGIGLVIIDSLAATSSGDENSAEFARIPMDKLRWLAEETGVHFAVIHHSPKNDSTGTPRGSSVFSASPDLVVEVKSAETSDRVEFITRKARDSKAGEWAGRCTWTEEAQDSNRNSFAMVRAEVRKREEGEGGLSEAEEYVLDYLSEHGESSRSEIAEAAEGCSASAAQKALYRLLAKGVVRKTNDGHGGRGNKGVYALAEDQEENAA